MRLNFKQGFLLFLALILLNSCYEEKYKPLPTSFVWKPDFALPLIAKSFTIEKSMVMPEGDFEINIDVEGIPDWARYYDLVLSDTVDFALSDIINEADYIRFIEFSVRLENEFPSNGQIQVYFLDDYGNVLAELFDENPLEVVTSNFTEDGAIVSTGLSSATVTINQDRIETIGQAKYVVPVCKISNEIELTNLFNYYSGYSLTFSLSARIGVDIPITIE